MKSPHYGQAMAEYLVVASALVGAFYWGANTDCPGYDTCIEKLQKTIHNKYQGFSHSISAVQQYGELSGSGFNSSWGNGDGTGTVPGAVPGGTGVIPRAEGLQQKYSVGSRNGNTRYGRLVNNQYVVDQNGDTVGTYDSRSGEFTPSNGNATPGQVTRAILNGDGEPAEKKVVTRCNSEVLGFAYAGVAQGKYYNTVTLAPLDISDNCASNFEQPVNAEGENIDGAVVDKYFYPSVQSDGISDTAQQPAGEVVKFPLPAPDSCAIVKSGWDDGIDEQVLADRKRRRQEAREAELLIDPFAPEVPIDPELEALEVKKEQDQARLNAYNNNIGIRYGYVDSASCSAVLEVDAVF